jgi:hypothetical protein
MRHHVHMRLDLVDEALRLEIGDDALPGVFASLPGVGTAVLVEPPVVCHHVDQRQAVALADRDAQGEGELGVAGQLVS